MHSFRIDDASYGWNNSHNPVNGICPLDEKQCGLQQQWTEAIIALPAMNSFKAMHQFKKTEKYIVLTFLFERRKWSASDPNS